MNIKSMTWQPLIDLLNSLLGSKFGQQFTTLVVILVLYWGVIEPMQRQLKTDQTQSLEDREERAKLISVMQDTTRTQQEMVSHLKLTAEILERITAKQIGKINQ